MIKIKVAGKINLALNVMKAVDGYHTLDMVTASVNVFDYVSIKEAKALKCNLTEIIPMEENSAYIAAKNFIDEFDVPPVEIEIEKNIPMLGGMGGSSADAAAVVFGMAEMFDIQDYEKLTKVARSAGSDVPLMYVGGFNRVRGTGEVVRHIGTNLEFDILTIKIEEGTSTAEVYEQFDKEKVKDYYDVYSLVRSLGKNDWFGAVSRFGNSLQTPALKINPKIKNEFEFLKRTSCQRILLYGSGSAVGGIFKDGKQIDKIIANNKNEFPYMEHLKTVEKGIEIVE